MSTRDANIKPLPPDVVAKIKSSTSITNLNGVVVELVKNALDANAHSIIVTVDFQRGGCIVEDDGEGIPPAEFEVGGGLGKAHHTSKFQLDREVHGRRGLFLASLASLSLLTITSRHLRHRTTNSVIFHHSTPIARLIPAPVQQGLRFSGHGTCVTVNDLFGNMPVRVKSRALAHQKPDEVEREWEDLKQLLVALTLANDQLAKLVISDGSKGRKITVHPQSQGQQAGELDLKRISSILAQAGLINFQSPNDCWNVVSACVPDFSIYAAICLVPSPTKRVQFISLGMAPVFPRNSTNMLYNDLNQLFASSDFGTTRTTSSSVQNSLEDGHMNAKALPKAVNKWPMFYVRINTNTSDRWYEDCQEIAPESDKSVQRILDVLAAMIGEFLTQLNLRPRAGKRKRKVSQVSAEAPQEDSKSTRQPRGAGKDRAKASDSTEEAFDGRLKLPLFKRPVPPTTSQHFGDWSRVKGAKDVVFDTKLNATKSVDIPSRVCSPAQSVQPVHLSGNQRESATDTTLPWTDPYTGRIHMVNSRTGQSMDSTDAHSERPRSTGYLQPNQVLDRVRRPRSAIPIRTGGSWIDGVLRKWENPTFSRSERPISSINIEVHEHESDRTTFNAHDCCGDLCGLNMVKFSKFRGKLWKQHLQGAEVVAQVDRKFILTKLPASSVGGTQDGTALALIDQHAADERCRVERLFVELLTSESGDFGEVQTIPVEPIIFEAPISEEPLLKRYWKHFRPWGVDYRIEQAANKLRVFVHLLPILIAERCRTEPSLVADLIRGEIWKCEERGSKPGSTTAHLDLDSGSTTSWVERLTGCPQGIIDLLNSRACRTAIMFNDVLSIHECQKLVAQLAQCAFPFQCAHSRPSMVPILDMEVQDSSLLVSESLDSLGLELGDGDETSKVGFAEAFGMAYKSESID
ncbi:hypothetical protein SI65_03188 [Aspergillus cristatus]|uniref:MutL C-terminal dimerisation domain-containing protein n=1 Tax=Aspergillus cristatus TaxID=573508 RepID=A0A1E3BMZ1_ASPCR|nr:hypothetical protein SI65_03188 [Aspergillus cristatus]